MSEYEMLRENARKAFETNVFNKKLTEDFGDEKLLEKLKKLAMTSFEYGYDTGYDLGHLSGWNDANKENYR